MCRLLAIASADETTVAQALGAAQLGEFTELSRFHDDGWGAAWTRDDGTVATIHGVDEAGLDERYWRFVDSQYSKGIMIHLRWASKGMAVAPENSHPFRSHGTAMIHNGNIAPAKQMESMLDPESLRELRGGTDSERYFAYILQCARREGDFEAGLARAVSDMKHAYPGHSLNAMLMREDRIYVVNVHEGATFDLSHDPEKLDGPIPWQHDPSNYYPLEMQWRGTSLIVASTGIRDGDWRRLPQESILVIDTKQGIPTIHTLQEGI